MPRLTVYFGTRLLDDRLRSYGSCGSIVLRAYSDLEVC
jgi:hypothetical protein